jgi:carboxyl-terminal processing protease
MRIFALMALLIQLLVYAHPDEKKAKYDLVRMEALSWVIIQLDHDYVDPSRFNPKKMLKSILEFIERRIPEIEIDYSAGKALIKVGSHFKTIPLAAPETLWNLTFLLRPVMAFIAGHLEPNSEPQKVEFAAINGLLSTLDPHSNLLPPELFKEMRLKTTGEFGGLGVRITLRRGVLTVIAPMSDTPASRMGIKALDQIVRIADQSTVNMPLDEAVNLLRGKPGTKVSIWIERTGWSEPHKYVITRETIKVQSITSELLDKKVGYISIQDFSHYTGADLYTHLMGLKRKSRGLKGLILDLRNNSGGLLRSAIQIADLFLSHGVIVKTVSYASESTDENRIQQPQDENRARSNGTEEELPMVVLVNSGSASASEILAGALKNLDRAVLVGEQTFGKGTVQVLNNQVPSSIEGACLKMTMHEYLIPGDVSIQEIGVTPDIRVIPMLIDKDDPQLYAQPERMREEDIPAHLKKQQDKIAQNPEVEIRYVFEDKEKKKKKKEDDSDSEPEQDLTEPKFKEDFEIRFARDFLAQAGSPQASTMLAQGSDFIAQVKSRESEKMAKSMRRLGLDWSAGRGEGAKSRVKFELLGAGKDGLAKADSKVRMKLSVKNTGRTPFFRLRAATKSPIALFDRREFLFGRVDPGRTKSWILPIKVPRSVLSRTDELRFEFHCEGSVPPKNYQITAGTKGLPRPAFGFSWQVIDKQGNGDGLIQAGETIDLALTVYNQGKGKAFSARALLKNSAGKDLFLESDGGRLNFKGLNPGQSKTESFRFSVRMDATQDSLPVELSIWDSALSVTQQAELKLPLYKKAGKIIVRNSGLRVKRAKAAVRGGADVSAPLIAYAKKGRIIRSDRRIGDWFRLAGRKGPAGWIHASSVVLTGWKKANVTTPQTLIASVQHTPPKISISKMPVFVEKNDVLVLRGEVSDVDQDIRDVSVWVGNNKIHMQPGSQAKNPRRFPFEVSVPLDPGPNFISVIAREGNRFSSYESLVITRPGGLDKKKTKL